MLHLLPEIERIASTTDQSTSSGLDAPDGGHSSKWKKKKEQSGAWSQLRLKLREDVSGIIQSECKMLQIQLEEGMCRLEVKQRETLRQFAHGHGELKSVWSAWETGRTDFMELELGRVNGASPVSPLKASTPAGFSPDLGGTCASSSHQKPEALDEALGRGDDEDPASAEMSTAVKGKGMFVEKAARMAERGYHGTELAEASGWGRAAKVEQLPESRFRRGVDCFHFDGREHLDKFIKSWRFELCSSIIIFANAVFMGINADVQLDAASKGQESSSIWLILERTFTVVFTIEWALRLIVYQKWFLRMPDWKWNVLDTFLVVMSLVELILEATDSKVAAGTIVLRIARVVRLVRLLKIVRYISAFRELRLMVFGLFSSVRSLLWTFVMLGLVVYVFAICFVQAALSVFTRPVDDKSLESVALREDFITWFGSTTLSMRTLVIAISGGEDWSQFMYMLQEADEMYGVLFVCYIMLVFHGVLHVIASIFVDSAMTTSKVEKDELIRDEINQKDSYMTLMKTVLKEADCDLSGTISWNEFQKYIEDTRMTELFKAIEIDVTEARGLYKLLDVDESDEVPIEEFVTGCFRLKGGPKGLDLASLMHENKKMMRVFMKFMSYSQEQFEALATKLGVEKIDGPHYV